MFSACFLACFDNPDDFSVSRNFASEQIGSIFFGQVKFEIEKIAGPNFFLQDAFGKKALSADIKGVCGEIVKVF